MEVRKDEVGQVGGRVALGAIAGGIAGALFALLLHLGWPDFLAGGSAFGGIYGIYELLTRGWSKRVLGIAVVTGVSAIAGVLIIRWLATALGFR